MDTAWSIKGSACTGKDLPSAVWTDCQSVSGICQSRYTVNSERGCKQMIRFFTEYKKNRRFAKYFFGFKKIMV